MKIFFIAITLLTLSACTSLKKDPVPPCACYNPQPANQQFGV